MTEPVLVGAGSGSRFGVLPYESSLTMPSGRKGPKKRKRKEMSKRSGTLVDLQTEELATGYTGLINMNRI